jgi:hypothetical protein
MTDSDASNETDLKAGTVACPKSGQPERGPLSRSRDARRVLTAAALLTLAFVLTFHGLMHMWPASGATTMFYVLSAIVLWVVAAGAKVVQRKEK